MVLRRLFAIGLPLACALGVFVLGSLPAGTGPPRVNDKVAHFVVFAFVAVSAWPASGIVLQGVARRTSADRVKPSLFLMLLLSAGYATGIGALLEVLQSTLPHRTAEWGDLLADVLGAIFGAWIALRVTKWQRRFGAVDRA